MALSRFPLVYCPRGVDRPQWFPLGEAHAQMLGAGPDAKKGGDGTITGGDGTCYNGAFRPGAWRRTAAGWWILPEGHLPEHLVRLDPPASILRWRTVAGADPKHRWQVPVLLVADITETAITWRSALDRVYTPEGWRDPEAFLSVQERLMALTQDRLLADEDDANERALIALALDILRFGQHGDAELWGALGWISETFIARVLVAACDREASV